MNQLTNQYFNYRETPVNYDGTGTLVDIKGNTVVFNQLVKQSGNTQTVNGVTFTNNGDGSWTVNGTAIDASPFKDVSDQFNLVSGHKYLVLGGVNGGSNNTYRMDIRPTSGVTKEFYNEKEIWTSNVSIGDARIVIRIQNGTTVNNIKYRPQVIDLTAIGIDNLTTVEQVETWLSNNIGLLPYYAYTTGKLLPFKGKELKTTGKNLLPSNNWEQGSINGTTGQNTSSNNRIRTTDYITLPKGNYYLSLKTGFLCFLFIYDLSNNFEERTPVSWTNGTSLELAQSKKIRIIIRKTTDENIATSEVENTNVQLEFGSSASSYEPYTSSTINLPTLTYFPTGMKDCSQSSPCYDEMISNKATGRVDEIDLGSLEWEYYSSGATRFVSTGIKNLVKKPPTISSIANIKCAKYITGSAERVYQGLAGIAIQAQTESSAGEIWIYDSAYSNAAAFKQMLIDNDVKLYYELETPTEEPISPALDMTFNVWNGGTEQLLPENTSVPITSPILCDIDYRGLISVNAVADPSNYGNVVGYGQKRYHESVTLTATPVDEFHRFLRWEDENGDTLTTNSSYTFTVGDE